MTHDRTISDFKQRKLHVDFVEMLLMQNKSGDDVISYKGNGYIRQTEADILVFKLYANETRNTDFATSFNRLSKIKSGELYSYDDHYTLSGSASDGSTWKAEHVLPECSWQAGHPNPIVHGKLSSANSGELVPNPRSLTLHFFEKADLPCPFREMKFRAAGCEFHVESGDDSFVVRARSDTALPEHFAMRTQEALRFLLAQPVTPRAVVQPRRIVLTSTALKSPSVRLGPPIARGSPAFLGRSWDLFGLYLDFVVHKTKYGTWNPCTGYLHNAHEASANSLDAWAIGLSVAVEGLANMINIEHNKIEKQKRKIERDRLKKLQAFIVKQVSSRKRLKDFADRVRGLVGTLQTVRAIDRMIWLADHGGADPQHIDAWKKLRNRGVHPTATGDVDIASLDFQKYVDDLHRVTILLYHIVFHLIGYRGPYTDYSTRNFPVKEYPPALAPRKHDVSDATA